jgi:hypothetical protein
MSKIYDTVSFRVMEILAVLVSGAGLGIMLGQSEASTALMSCAAGVIYTHMCAWRSHVMLTKNIATIVAVLDLRGETNSMIIEHLRELHESHQQLIEAHNFSVKTINGIGATVATHHQELFGLSESLGNVPTHNKDTKLQ